MDLKLQKSVALITGASRGIGKAIATRFAEEGATVLITYASASAAAEELVGSLRGRGLAAHAYKVDVRDEAGMAELVQTIEREFSRSTSW